MTVGLAVGVWDAGTLLLLIATFLAACWLFPKFTTRKYPPGPTPWPVIGHIPNMVLGKNRFAFLDKLADDYGPIATIWLGSQPVVMLNSLDIVREAYISKAALFDARPFPYIAQIVFEGKRSGVIINNGESHKAMRKKVLLALHDFGLGKQSLDEKIQEEARELSEVIQKAEGKTISNIKRTMELAISNVIISICFGNRLSYEDPEFIQLVKQIEYFFANNLFFQPDNFFSIFRYLPMTDVASKIVATQDSLKSYVRKQIKAHRETFDSENIRDFVDLYLTAEKENDEYFNADNLFRTIVDLFAAGTETTATTMSWTLLYLIKYPSIQDKAQHEINKVLGRHTLPSAKDRDKIVYIDALLHEVWRKASVASVGAPRFLTEQTTLGGYEMPKDCYVFPNIYRIHMDKDYWKDPENFRPERWIDSTGSLIKHDHYLPFSIGRRSCLGETFAKAESFIVLTTLLQRFRFSVPKGFPEPSEEAAVGITRAPAAFDLCAVPIK